MGETLLTGILESQKNKTNGRDLVVKITPVELSFVTVFIKILVNNDLLIKMQTTLLDRL